MEESVDDYTLEVTDTHKMMRYLIPLIPGHGGLASDQCAPFHCDKSASSPDSILKS